jgi:hypothetical protein
MPGVGKAKKGSARRPPGPAATNGRLPCPVRGCYRSWACTAAAYSQLRRHLNAAHPGAHLPVHTLERLHTSRCDACGLLVGSHLNQAAHKRVCKGRPASARAGDSASEDMSADDTDQQAPTPVQQLKDLSLEDQAVQGPLQDGVPPHPDDPPPAEQLQGVSPIAPAGNVAPLVPYQARAAWAEATAHSLRQVADARQRGAGQGAPEAVDNVLRLAGKLLADSSASRGRARRVAARIRQGAGDPDTADPERAPGRRPARPAVLSAAEALRMRTQRIRGHLRRGSIQRASRVLRSCPLVTIDAAAAAALQELHPPAPEPDMPAETGVPALQVDEDTLRAVLLRVPKGSAPGPSGWTYEHVRSAALHSDAAFDATLSFVNAMLSGELPHCPNLLASRLIALDKTRGAGAADGSLSLRPIAIGEVWVRLAGLCALQAGAHPGASLAPLQLGVGVKGGAQIMGHALRAGTEAAGIVTLQVDIRNAFNTVSRTAMLAQIAERQPRLLPFARWAYSQSSQLYADPLSEDLQGQGLVLESQAGVRQGDPCGPLFFALALQPVLEATLAAEADADLLAYADDVTLQGTSDAVAQAFAVMQRELARIGLAVNSAKTRAYSVDADAARTLATRLGCQASADGLIVAGTPLGTETFVHAYTAARCTETERCISELLECDLTPQESFLVLHGSLQHREEHLLRVTPWAQLQHHLPALEQRLLQAAQLIVGLSDSEVGPQHKQQLQLPHRHGGMGLVSFSEPLADAAFVSAAAQCDGAIAGGPARFQRSSGGCWGLQGHALERLSEALPELFPPDMERLGLEMRALCHLQAAASRALAARAHAELLEQLAHTPLGQLGVGQEDGDPLDKQRAQARLRSCAGRPASAWLTTLPTTDALRLTRDEFVFNFRMRLGLLQLFVDDGPHTCFCSRQVRAQDGEHALVCTTVRAMVTSRHDNLSAVWRRIFARAGVSTTWEPSVSAVQAAQRGKATAGYSRGDILALTPTRTVLADVSVAHPGAQAHALAAAAQDGATARAVERRKRAHYQRLGSANYHLAPLVHESYGRMGEAATELLSRLGASAEDTGSCSKRAFVESALRELSVALCRGNSRIVRAYTAVVARVAGKALLPGLPVASADAADTDSL